MRRTYLDASVDRLNPALCLRVGVGQQVKAANILVRANEPEGGLLFVREVLTFIVVLQQDGAFDFRQLDGKEGALEVRNGGDEIRRQNASPFTDFSSSKTANR